MAYRNNANPELARAMHGLRSSSAASPHLDKRTKRVRTRSAALAAEVALEQGVADAWWEEEPDPHVYDGERCIFCNVNTYDNGIYGPFECVDRAEPLSYSTESGQ